MISESTKLGILAPLFQDAQISEIMVNGPGRIFVEKNGKLLATQLKFSDENALQGLIFQLAQAAGKNVSPQEPFFDAHLPDGSRINAVIPPMAPRGSLLTIRRFQKNYKSLSDLIKISALSEKCALFLDAVIKGRLNLVVSGGTGTGKTTFLNALSSLIPPEERIVTIEDISELQLQHPNWVALEAVHNSNSKISARDCLINSLRMRPDRIIIGECRRDETFEMLQAMNTGHEGSMTSLHANSPRDCLSRIESMITSSGNDIPLSALRPQILSAIDIIIQLKRDRNGTRYVSEVIELSNIEQGMITTQQIFIREKSGELVSSGLVPQLIERLQDSGIKLAANFFDPKTKVTFYQEPPHQND